MADQTRRRNVGSSSPAQSSGNGVSGPLDNDNKQQQKKKKDQEAEPEPEDLEPLPQLFSFSTWPSYAKLFPLYIVVTILLVRFYNSYQEEQDRKVKPLDLSSYPACTQSFNYSFPVNAAHHHSYFRSVYDWEVGAAVEAQLELLHPHLSVFSSSPFPDDKLPSQRGWKMIGTVNYAYKRTWIFGAELSFNSSAATDAAALGIGALLVSRFPGKDNFLAAATKEKDFLLEQVPRLEGGAIGSSRAAPAEAKAEALDAVAPFLAYHAVATDDVALARESVAQVAAYRDALAIRDGALKGLWKHAAGAAESDPRAWSTGNAWAAFAIARVRATLAKWAPTSASMAADVRLLDDYVAEILDACIRLEPREEKRLLRNHLGNETSFAEAAGTSLMVATAYRMAVENPARFGRAEYLDWAHEKRRAVVEVVDDDGKAVPTVEIREPGQGELVDDVSPVGSSFLLMMGTAWRDCVCAGVCNPDVGTPIKSTDL